MRLTAEPSSAIHARHAPVQREESFFDDFEKHAAKTVEGCRVFLEMAVSGKDCAAGSPRIKVIESECDHITHGVVARLHKTFITPIDRNDIFRLISKMDDVMDFVEAAAQRLLVYDIHKPTPELADLARTLLHGAERVWRRCRGCAI